MDEIPRYTYRGIENNLEAEEYYESSEKRRRAISTICNQGCRSYCFGREILKHARLPINDSCCPNHRDNVICINQETLYNSRMKIRTMIQLKGMIIKRYEESIKSGADIGSNNAAERWILKDGEKFREKYDHKEVDTHHILESVEDRLLAIETKTN